MAQARLGPGGRPGGARFAQFKLVLLGMLTPHTGRRMRTDVAQESQPLGRYNEMEEKMCRAED